MYPCALIQPILTAISQKERAWNMLQWTQTFDLLGIRFLADDLEKNTSQKREHYETVYGYSAAAVGREALQKQNKYTPIHAFSTKSHWTTE